MSGGIKVIDNTDKATYDSTKPRLQIAVDRNPPHINRVTVEPGPLTADAGNNYQAREVLFEMKHDLGYKPKVLIYFFRPSLGRYDCGKTFFGLGARDDYLEYDVTEERFRITHRLTDNLAIGFSSSAQEKTTCKFMIFSNPVNTYTDPAKR